MLLALKIHIYPEPPQSSEPDNFIKIQKNLHNWGYQGTLVTSFFLVVICMTLLKHGQVGYQNK